MNKLMRNEITKVSMNKQGFGDLELEVAGEIIGKTVDKVFDNRCPSSDDWVSDVEQYWHERLD